jgi:hypothetical protein
LPDHRSVVGFRLLSPISSIEIVASGRELQQWRRLRRAYGPGRWRKLKGIAFVLLADGCIRLAEVHWYECHGLGRRELKLKRLLGGRR